MKRFDLFFNEPVELPNPVSEIGIWPKEKERLYEKGIKLVIAFCNLNDLPIPSITKFPPERWHGLSCAHYRPDEGICINLEMCASPCTEAQARAYSWPANITDREPYGVIAHELGHHVDWQVSSPSSRRAYWGDYSKELRRFTCEKPITSYCDGDEEWFAEIFRLFLTNPDLLRIIRPKTYRCLAERFKPLFAEDWKTRLGSNVPPKIIKALNNKGVK